MTAPAVAAIPVVGAPVLAVSWWCSASPRNWTWTPAPYVGAWVILAAVAGLAIWWRVRGRHTEPEPDAREAEALEVGSGPYRRRPPAGPWRSASGSCSCGCAWTGRWQPWAPATWRRRR